MSKAQRARNNLRKVCLSLLNKPTKEVHSWSNKIVEFKTF